MTGFEVVVLGVGDTFSERHHPTSLLLRTDRFHLAIDCPDMYRRVLRDASDKGAGQLDLRNIDDVLITHIHGDHMNGLEGLGFFKHFGEGKRARIHTLPEVQEVLWERRLQVAMGQLWTEQGYKAMRFDDYFEARPLTWAGLNTIGPFQVEVRRTLHHVPTCALKVRYQDRLFGFSGDTAFDPDLIDWLSETDLFIHETNLGAAHTHASDLAGLPTTLQHKMRLIHYPDTLDLSTLPIQPLREGEVISI